MRALPPCWRGRLPLRRVARLVLSATGSATRAGVAAALVLATSGRLASSGRDELAREAPAGGRRAFREMKANSGIPAEKMILPQDVAEAV